MPLEGRGLNPGKCRNREKRVDYFTTAALMAGMMKS